MTGDRNPLHLDPAYAARTRFGQRIAHGMLTAGFVSAVIGMHLPGPGGIYVSQTLQFVRPVRIGDAVTATVEVVAYDARRRRLTLRTTVANQHGETVLDGEAVVLVEPPKPARPGVRANPRRTEPNSGALRHMYKVGRRETRMER